VKKHATSANSGRDLLGHPRGLFYIGGTELWERISFHGMQALLVLYMVEHLLLPGHVEHIAGFARFRAVIEGVTGQLSSQALASQIFGLYVGLVYLPLGSRLCLFRTGRGCRVFQGGTSVGQRHDDRRLLPIHFRRQYDQWSSRRSL
jgi:hypothetical protein